MRQIQNVTVTRYYEASYAYVFEAMTFLVGIEKLHSTVCSVILCIYTSDFILPIVRCVIPFVLINTIRRGF